MPTEYGRCAEGGGIAGYLTQWFFPISGSSLHVYGEEHFCREVKQCYGSRVLCVMTRENISSMAHVRLMNILWKINLLLLFPLYLFFFFVCGAGT